MKDIIFSKLETYDTTKYMLTALGDHYSYWKGRQTVVIDHSSITHMMQYDKPNKSFLTARVSSCKLDSIPISLINIEDEHYLRLNWFNVLDIDEDYLRSRATEKEYREYLADCYNLNNYKLCGKTAKEIISKYFQLPKGIINRTINGKKTQFLRKLSSSIPDLS